MPIVNQKKSKGTGKPGSDLKFLNRFLHEWDRWMGCALMHRLQTRQKAMPSIYTSQHKYRDKTYNCQ